MYRPEQNYLLSSLPVAVQGRVFPHLDLMPLPAGKTIHESGEAIQDVYFPIDCIVSLLYVMGNAESADISLVGREGLVGVSLFMGGESTTSHAVVRSAGAAYRLSGQRLKKEFALHGELLQHVLRYTQSLLTQMSQTAVCNRHHSVGQQLCRWLLHSLDRLNGSELLMTQKTIANMLGVRREGVTEAAGKLQKLGIIEYKRGRISVIDRLGLEQFSCECYQVIKQETDRLILR